MRNNTIRKAPLWLGAIVLASGLVATSAQAASAQEMDHDRPKITENDRDFGLHWTLGAPRNGGHLSWDLNSNGTYTPRLTGYLYLNNSEDECAKIEIQHFDASHVCWTPRTHPSTAPRTTARCSSGSTRTATRASLSGTFTCGS